MPNVLKEPGSAVRIQLEEQEAALMRNLLDELRMMLGADNKADPVMERLFPRAYDTETEENTYKELTESELQDAKRRTLDTIEESITGRGDIDVKLSDSQAEQWLRGLNDLRLAIGTRLGVTEEAMAQELDPDDEKSPAMAVLHWLGWIQEAMLEAMSGREQDPGNREQDSDQ